MKTIISLLFGMYLFIGCQDSNNSPLGTEKEDDTIILGANSLNKDSGDDYGEFIYNLGDIQDFKVKASKKFRINGNEGGKIELKVSWEFMDGEKVELTAKLKVPKDAFIGDLDFDMIFNLQEYNLELYPSPYTFNIPVELDMKFKNVDVSLFSEEGTEFSYVDNLNENVTVKKNKVDHKKREIEVEDALLDHFSRYGWTRTTPAK